MANQSYQSNNTILRRLEWAEQRLHEGRFSRPIFFTVLLLVGRYRGLWAAFMFLMRYLWRRRAKQNAPVTTKAYRPQKNVKGLVLLLVGFLMLSSLGIQAATPVHAEEISAEASVEVIEDIVAVLPVNTVEWTAVQGRTTLRTGDQVGTGPTGSALIVWFDDGTMIELGPDTVIVINEFSQTADSFVVDIELLEGTIFNTVNRLINPNSRYEIHTPSFEVAVRGTVFAVEVTAHYTSTVVVQEGTVATSMNNTEVAVTAETWLEAGPNENLGTAQAISAADDTSIAPRLRDELAAFWQDAQNGMLYDEPATQEQRGRNNEQRGTRAQRHEVSEGLTEIGNLTPPPPAQGNPPPQNNNNGNPPPNPSVGAPPPGHQPGHPNHNHGPSHPAPQGPGKGNKDDDD